MSKTGNKKKMIFLHSETKLKFFFEIIGVSLWPSSNPDLKPLEFAIFSILENKTNLTSHPNIGSLKTAIEEEWNKRSEEIILKVGKLFRG